MISPIAAADGIVTLQAAQNVGGNIAIERIVQRIAGEIEYPVPVEETVLDIGAKRVVGSEPFGREPGVGLRPDTDPVDPLAGRLGDEVIAREGTVAGIIVEEVGVVPGAAIQLIESEPPVQCIGTSASANDVRGIVTAQSIVEGAAGQVLDQEIVVAGCVAGLPGRSATT